MDSQDKKIQEMRLLEQNLQNLLLQKQAFQMELAETQVALKEIKGSESEIFKIVGQLMIKTDKLRIKKELLDKEKIIGLRIKAIEKQEKNLTEKLDLLREEVMKSLKK